MIIDPPSRNAPVVRAQGESSVSPVEALDSPAAGLRQRGGERAISPQTANRSRDLLLVQWVEDESSISHEFREGGRVRARDGKPGAERFDDRKPPSLVEARKHEGSRGPIQRLNVGRRDEADKVNVFVHSGVASSSEDITVVLVALPGAHERNP